MIKYIKRTAALLLTLVSLLNVSAEVLSYVGGSFSGSSNPFYFRGEWIEDDCIYGPVHTSLGDVYVGGDSSRPNSMGGNWYVWTDDGEYIEHKSTLEGFAHVFGCLEYNGNIYFVGGTWGQDWMAVYNIQNDTYKYTVYPEQYPCKLRVKRHYLIREHDGLIYVSNSMNLSGNDWLVFDPQSETWIDCVHLKGMIKEGDPEIKYTEPKFEEEL